MWLTNDTNECHSTFRRLGPSNMMKTTLFLCVLLQLAPDSSLAVVTSDENGSHVTTPGEPAFGVNVDGVALLAGDVASSETN